MLQVNLQLIKTPHYTSVMREQLPNVCQGVGLADSCRNTNY